MSAEAIRAAMVTLLQGVPSIGIVHSYERYADKQADFRALYTSGGTLLGWFVSRTGWRYARTASGRLLVTTRWQITGFLGLEDATASELVMQGLVETICAAWSADPTMGGIIRGLPIEGSAGIEVAAIEPVMFASVLCHRARIELITQHYEGSGGEDGLLVDPATRWLITAIVSDLRADAAIMAAASSIEGALAFDPDDDPGGVALIVVPLGSRANGGATNTRLRDRVAVTLGVIIAAPSGYPAGAGARAADGLDVLDRLIRARLHGWGDGLSSPAGDPLDEPLTALGGEFLRAAPGRIAWRASYRAGLIIEVSP